MSVMPPIPDANRYATYSVVASTTNFAVPFPLFGQSDLKVYYNGTLLTYGTDYSVISTLYGTWSLAPNPVTDSVVVLTTPITTGTIEIYGGIKPNRAIQATKAFSTFDFNYAFSYLVAALRELYHQFTRAVQVPGNESGGLTLPSIAARAGNVLAFDGSGNPVAATPATGGVVGTSSILDGAVTLPKLASGIVDADQNLAANSDGSIATQKATKAYADGKVSAAMQAISASVAANALTVGWTPDGKISFRNATLANGTPVSVKVASALSLTVPSGATLGTTNGQQAVLALLLLYNAGTPILGIVNAVSGLNLDETGLVSSTTISGASNSASTIYSASAVTNSPYRVIGTITITEATAGTWALAPTLVQGDGGRGLFRALPVQSMVRVSTGSGHGSINTKIRRFTNVITNQGSDITYADSATNGASFTINTNGNYAISYSDQFNVQSFFGVSLNTSAPTTNVVAIPASERLCGTDTGAGNYAASVAITVNLTAGSVIRPHGIGSGDGSIPALAQFTITRVS